MNIFARKWFYKNPGRITHNIAENVRQSFWSSGLYNIWIDSINNSAPYKVQGHHNSIEFEMEWHPSRWLKLRTTKNNLQIQNHISWMLEQKCNISFVDQNNHKIYEWHLEDFDKRWRELSGNPIYSELERIN
tara:strand:+ start:4230 stop:4625 length:396 start_codon:yes stop_codon:yes gene_type:complete